MDALNHWRYFLSLESDFNDCLRYVEFNSEQEGVYSFEFARLLMLSCAELDVVFKLICAYTSPGIEVDSIGKYCASVSAKYHIQAEEVQVPRFSRTLIPFGGWSQVSAPLWWSAHNKVKHRRHENFHLASALNVLQAVAGLFVANLVLLSASARLDSIGEYPALLGREYSPGYLMFGEGYRVLAK